MKTARGMGIAAKVFFLVFIVFLVSAQSMSAQTILKVGVSTEPASLDPQYSTTGATQQASQQIFETIITRSQNLRMSPSLALSWKTIDPLKWELKLRQGVKFHDGKEFGSDDIVF